ncbi:helix-turn-helix domain-containing protein [Paraglaciecola sp.]|uniref:helix-turn-helix domain-containing protein n=1 Tax=Paraglaciecola sp. TaxID=1920173 RepID=UPI0030F3AE1D
MITTLLYAGALQGIFVAIVLLFQGQAKFRQSRVPLAALIMLLSYDLLLEALYFSRDILHFPHLAGTDILSSFLYGPLLWWYCFCAMRQQSPKPIHLIQLLPAIVAIVLAWSFFTSPSSDKINYLQAAIDQPDVDVDSLFFWTLHIVSGVIYSVTCGQMVWRYKRLSPNKISYEETQKLAWLMSLTTIFAVIWLAAIVQLGLLLLAQQPSETAFMLPNLVYALALYVMGYMAIRNPLALFGDVGVTGDGNEVKALAKLAVCDKSGFQLSKERVELVTRLINQAMIQQQIFLNPTLKLRDLALNIKTPEHHISLVLNREYAENFFSYVNRFRIQYAKKLLQDESQLHLTMLDVALTAGFNSKSTFYSQFKAHQAMTPLQFREQLKAQ